MIDGAVAGVTVWARERVGAIPPFTGHTILITGGAGGIGRHLSRRFLADGNRVVVCGRNEATLAEAAAELPGLETVVCDVADRASVEELGRVMETHYPELDVVINNAAVTGVVDLHDEGSAAEIERQVMVNIMGPVNVSSRLLPLLEKQPSAVLAVVTSGIAYAPASDVPGYSLTKAAMNSLWRSLRYTQRNSGVRLVEIVPPAVDTDMVAGLECPKMDPVDVADKVARGLAAGRTEIRMGETHLSYRLNRLSPLGAEKLIRMAFD